jgi:hypothetical protein
MKLTCHLPRVWVRCLQSRPSAIMAHYFYSLSMPIEALSAGCFLLELIWRPLALCCAIRLVYAVQFVHKLEKATKTSPSIIRSIQSLLVVIPSLHWIACMFCFLALAPSSWLQEYQEIRGETLNNSASRIYLHSIYWTLDTASTRGSGEVNITSDKEVGHTAPANHAKRLQRTTVSVCACRVLCFARRRSC